MANQSIKLIYKLYLATEAWQSRKNHDDLSKNMKENLKKADRSVVSDINNLIVKKMMF